MQQVKLNRSLTPWLPYCLIIAGAMMWSHQVQAADRYEAKGRVIKVTPQYQSVNHARQECRTEYRNEVASPRRSMAGTVIGGIAGGLLGSQIGKGNGRVAAAAIGAGIGAITGDRINRNQAAVSTTRRVPVDVCYSVDDWQQQKTGYLVDYQYQGRQYSMLTDQHPGKFVILDVRVTPVNSNNIRSGLNTGTSVSEFAWRDSPSKRRVRHHYY